MYQPAKFHWPRLSGSNFRRAGGKHPPDLHALKKPSPYRVKGCFIQYKRNSENSMKDFSSIVDQSPILFGHPLSYLKRAVLFHRSQI